MSMRRGSARSSPRSRGRLEMSVPAVDDARAGFRILACQQTRRELAEGGVRVGARGDDPLAFAAFQVEIDLSKPHRIRPGVGPIHILPELSAAAEEIVELLIAGLA